jgi:hypothetical protein
MHLDTDCISNKSNVRRVTGRGVDEEPAMLIPLVVVAVAEQEQSLAACCSLPSRWYLQRVTCCKGTQKPLQQQVHPQPQSLMLLQQQQQKSFLVFLALQQQWILWSSFCRAKTLAGITQELAQLRHQQLSNASLSSSSSSSSGSGSSKRRQVKASMHRC